jgi:hypothetical protein
MRSAGNAPLGRAFCQCSKQTRLRCQEPGSRRRRRHHHSCGIRSRIARKQKRRPRQAAFFRLANELNRGGKARSRGDNSADRGHKASRGRPVPNLPDKACSACSSGHIRRTPWCRRIFWSAGAPDDTAVQNFHRNDRTWRNGNCRACARGRFARTCTCTHSSHSGHASNGDAPSSHRRPSRRERRWPSFPRFSSR